MSSGNVATTISDPFALRVLKPVTVILFLITAVPGIAAIVVLLGTGFFTEAEPFYVPLVTKLVLSFKGLPGGITAVAAQALPALTGALCFSGRGGPLNRTGKISFLVLLASAACALCGLIFVNPDDLHQTANVTGGGPALSALYKASNFSLNTGLTYLFLLVGLHFKIT